MKIEKASGVISIEGSPCSGRSARLARLLREASACGRGVVLVDSAGAWNWRLDELPPGLTIIDPKSVRGPNASARVLDLLVHLFYKSPGVVIGVDDAEFLGLDDFQCRGVKAAAGASGGVLIWVGARAESQAPRIFESPVRVLERFAGLRLGTVG